MLLTAELRVDPVILFSGILVILFFRFGNIADLALAYLKLS